jgi:hypothetical protein
MGLPLLKVPEDLVEPRSRVNPLEVVEETVELGETRARDLWLTLEGFVSAIQALVGQLSEEDVIEAFEQIAAEEARHRPAVRGLQSTLDAFGWGKDQLETLRDAVLVREAQELSAPAFWGDDEE